MLPSSAPGLGRDPPVVPPPYTHRLFVDFSGDDGRPGNGNSSDIISMAWVLSEVGEVRHNEGVVLKMKAKLGCGARDELKYKAVKRQERRKRESILEELENARVEVLVLIVVKRSIREEVFRDPRTKRLVQYIHHFPIKRFFDTESIPPFPKGWFQLVFDEVSWQGCQDEIRRLFAADAGIIWDAKRDGDSMVFGNSKSILMLQMADVFAGMMRDYFETLPARLPRCRFCGGKHRGDCTWHRTDSPVGNMRLLKLVYGRLLRFLDGRRLDAGVLVRPPELQPDYAFVDCLLLEREK